MLIALVMLRGSGPAGPLRAVASGACGKLQRMQSPAAAFAAHAARGELAIPVDPAGLPLWPPQVRGTGWRVSDGLGTVYATTTMRRPGEEPQDLSLVDLDDGVRLMSRIVGLAPDEVRIGLRVRLAWDGEVPVFAPHDPA